MCDTKNLANKSTHMKFGMKKILIQENGNNAWKQHSKYLGVVVDEKNGIYEKRNKIKQEQREKEQKEQKEQQILDYGDGYLLW